MAEIKTIFWDFDGVLMDSNPIRDIGFKKVLSEFPQDQVDELMVFHKNNGGWSRYVKFKYFFETIRKEEISEEEIKVWADKFSAVMLESLCNPDLLIEPTISFVKANYNHFAMHIVSGSDGNELRFVCEKLGIADYFLSIHGSPTPKTKLIQTILETNHYSQKFCLMVGDSYNDYEAASANSIHFKAYNNVNLESYTNFEFNF
ncbi:MAG: HAD-IA family hydrolase [Crocinitomicaceae bacterium]